MIAGRPTRVELRPAEAGYGLQARRGAGREAVRLDVEAAVRHPNVTGIEIEGEPVFVWEHFLAVLHVWGITDLEIIVEGSELPIFDGSAVAFDRALAEAGAQDLPGEADVLRVTVPIFLLEEDKCLAALPSGRLRVSYFLDYAHPLIGRQYFDWTLTGPQAGAEVIPARSFVPLEEVEALQRMGYLRGGAEENAIIVYPDRYSAPPALPQEFARHKVLDIVGDLYLAGRPVCAHVIGFRTGHAHNRVLLQRMLEAEEIRP